MSSLLDFSDLGLDIAQCFRGFNSTIMIASVLALLIIIPIYNSLRGLRTPRLQGPRSESFIFGNTRKIFPSTNLALVYQDWEQTYGPVYEIPTGFGSNHVVLSDLKAITHLFSKDTTTYCIPARTSALACKLSCSGRGRGDSQETTESPISSSVSFRHSQSHSHLLGFCLPAQNSMGFMFSVVRQVEQCCRS